MSAYFRSRKNLRVFSKQERLILAMKAKQELHAIGLCMKSFIERHKHVIPWVELVIHKEEMPSILYTRFPDLKIELEKIQQTFLVKRFRGVRVAQRIK